jgi:WD40 repeat protein
MIVSALISVAIPASQGPLPVPCQFSSIVPAAAADRLLVTCTDKPELKLLSSADGHLIRDITLVPPAGTKMNNVAVSPDGRAAAVSWRDGTITFFRKGETQPRSWHAPFYANSLVFSPDANRLYVDGTELDMQTARPTGRSLRGEFDAPNAITFDNSGRIAFVAEADTTIRMFEVASGKQLRTFRFDVEPLVADTDPQTGEVIAGLADGSMARFDRQLNLIRTYRGVPGTMPLAIVSNGTWLLAALAPQAGGAPPAAWMLDYTAGKWTEQPSANHTIAVQRHGTSIILYKHDGAALIAEELRAAKK